MQPRPRARTHHPFGRPAAALKPPPAVAPPPAPARLVSSSPLPNATAQNLDPAAFALPTATPFNLVFLTTVLLLITHFARPVERFQIGGRLPGIICGLGIFVLLISGGLKRMTSSIGIIVGCYIFWMLSCTPFSTWKGGSANYVLWYVAFWVVLMLMIAHAPRTPRDMVRIAGVVVFSCLFFLILGSKESFGRLAVEGTFGNSDDVALMAGFAIPFAILVGFQLKNFFLRYLFLALTVGFLLTTTGRTATRAAILAMIGLLAVYFFRSKAGQKMAILAVTAVAVVGLLFTLPDSVLDRLATIVDSFDAQTESPQDRTEAMASTAERRDLLSDAIKMTRDNPIFGVGPGEFPDYRYNFLRDALGRPKRFFPSHNTYAQIAAESGIPGLLLYLTFLVFTYRTIIRFRKLTLQSNHPEAALLQRIALCLEANLVYFAICAVFMTCDRHPHQFVIAGLAIAGERLLAYWTSQRPAAPPMQSDPLGARNFAAAGRFPNMLPARPAF